MAKKTLAERGYVSRESAAQQLRRLATDIEGAHDQQTVKLVITIYAAPNDGSVAPPPTMKELAEFAKTVLPIGEIRSRK